LYLHLAKDGYAHPSTSELTSEYELWVEKQKFQTDISKDHEQYSFSVVAADTDQNVLFWSYSRTNYTIAGYCEDSIGNIIKSDTDLSFQSKDNGGQVVRYNITFNSTKYS